ncbi:MAG: translation factor GTPase family protein [Eubacteriales bacterium]
MKSDKIVIGILAHVDAGKTTLAESMLFHSGEIRKKGRVDHRDAFLDTYELERARGITIFSKQAELNCGNTKITLLDTPGHVDFSTEMERTLRVLDYAILVISGPDGIQGHVQTLWKLLENYQIPTFIFVNKMDQQGTSRDAIMNRLHQRLSEHCVLFGDETCAQEEAEKYEYMAMLEEALLEEYLAKGHIGEESIRSCISNRNLFPCFFGSALKDIGIQELMKAVEKYTLYKEYPEEFATKIFKITRDEQGNRLTHMKVMGGTLRVKMPLIRYDEEGQVLWEEKADQLRVYSGVGYVAMQEIGTGTICAVTGLSKTKSGEGLGTESDWELPMLEPVLTYQIQLPEGINVYDMYLKLNQLQEEDPALHIVWDKGANEIQVQVMGEIQIEILKTLIMERFQVEVTFGSESIVYKETIADTVVGIGHFEPLRHYAEAHVLMEPGNLGSGVTIATDCSEDLLPRNWQHLVMTHLGERPHKGVLVGADVTDIKFTLLAGRGHLKHTEGGDFRQATYRAVRQGLMQAQSVILEPVYEYRLEIPTECTGRALNDIQKMFGTFEDPQMDGEMTVITGRAPVVTMRGYQQEVISYSKGFGRIFCTSGGYAPCHNQNVIIEGVQYDPVNDVDHPTDSVFCAHGAGYNVPWNEVAKAAHVENGFQNKNVRSNTYDADRRHIPFEERWINPEELEAIFQRTYGTVKREKSRYKKSKSNNAGNYISSSTYKPKATVKKEAYLLVDGYNIIFAWQNLKELAETNIEGARGKLMDILSNYQGYKKMNLIVVFDAYKVKGNPGSIEKYHNIDVVYTKEAETADAYIEKTVHKMARNYDVTVATSDALEQLIIMGQGGHRLSAQGLLEEIIEANHEIQEEHLAQQKIEKIQTLGDAIRNATKE